MFNKYEQKSELGKKSSPRFEKSLLPFPKNPGNFARRPAFPQRRRMIPGRYPNMGARPFPQPGFRPNFPVPPEYRYQHAPNSTFGPVAPRPPFPPNNVLNNGANQSPLPQVPGTVNCKEVQPLVASSDGRNQLNEMNMISDLWIETLAPNGRKYYFNARTRNTVWEKPVNVRIISLDEINSLKKCSGGTHAQNPPPVTGNQNYFVQQQQQQSFRPYNSFTPRNFTPMAPRFMLFPPPMCVPPPVVAPSIEPPGQETIGNNFNPLIRPAVFPFSFINGNLMLNNKTVDYDVNVSFNEVNVVPEQVGFQTSIGEEKSRREEIKISDWNVQEPSVSFALAGNEENLNSSEEMDESLLQQSFGSEKMDESVVQQYSSYEKMDESVMQQYSSSEKMDESVVQQYSSSGKMGENGVQHSSSSGKMGRNVSQQSFSSGKMDESILQQSPGFEKIHKYAVQKSSKNSDNIKIKIKIKLEDEGFHTSENEDSSTIEKESKTPEETVEESKSEPEQVDKSRPVSSTPVAGTFWYIVWTGDERVFFYNSQDNVSVWERPVELINRTDVDKLIEKSPLSLGLKTEKREVSKTTSNDSDVIKKLKKEEHDESPELGEKFGSDGKKVKEEEKPKHAAIPHEQRVQIFREMLAEKQVSAFSSWEKELHKIVYDSRYLLLTSKERRQVFDAYMSKKLEEEKYARQKDHQIQRKKFIALLEEAGVTWKSRFSDFARQYGKDIRFKAVDKLRQRENIFNQYVSDLIKKERDSERLLAAQKKNFIELLSEHNAAGRDTTWDEIQKDISNDERYKAIQSNYLKEKIFKEYTRGEVIDLTDERKERADASIRHRQEEVMRDLSVHLKNREKEQELHKLKSAVSDFKALLNDLMRDSEMSWHSAKKILRQDRRWEYAQCLDQEKLEEIFEQHIHSLNTKKKQQFHLMLDQLALVLTLKTSWLDVRKYVLKDPRCSKFSSSERKCEKEFKNYLKLKFHIMKKEFKDLLRETKLINYKSKSKLATTNHLKEIEEVLSQDKRYLNLECMRHERKEILLAYIDELHAEGPPPPPTATKSRSRSKVFSDTDP